MSWSKPPVALPLALALTLGLGVAGCKPAAPGGKAGSGESSQLAPANSPWQQSVDAFMAGWFERNPAAAAVQGKHEFDGRLPDWSPEGLKANIAWLHGQRDKLAGFKDDQL